MKFDFQNLNEILLDKFISSSEEYEKLWDKGTISIEHQLKDVLLNVSRDIFVVGHKMVRDTPFHSHDYYEIICVLGGTLKNNMPDNSIYMISGDICLMNLESSHSLEAVDPEAIIINIGIKKEEMENGIFSNLYKSDTVIGSFFRGKSNLNYLYYPNSQSSNLAGLYQSILTASSSSKDSAPFLLASQVMNLFVILLDRDEFSYYGIDDKVLRILSYIDDNYRTTSLSDIAQHFNYNESYLSRYIKKHTGKQLIKIITEKKMDKACFLLQNTKLSLEKIGEETGYQSYSHFHKIFRQNYGITPNEFRKSNYS